MLFFLPDASTQTPHRESAMVREIIKGMVKVYVYEPLEATRKHNDVAHGRYIFEDPFIRRCGFEPDVTQFFFPPMRGVIREGGLRYAIIRPTLMRPHRNKGRVYKLCLEDEGPSGPTPNRRSRVDFSCTDWEPCETIEVPATFDPNPKALAPLGELRLLIPECIKDRQRGAIYKPMALNGVPKR